MQTKIKFPTKRLLLTLFLCVSAIILLQNYSVSENSSFTFNLLCLVTGIAVCFLFFIPSFIIKKRSGLDFMSFAHIKTPSAIIFTSAFYAIYFVYTAEYFLLTYADMFGKKLNPDANLNVIALMLLLVCVYASYKGANAISRCGIFLFIFSFIAYILIFSGSISSLDFEHYSFSFNGNLNDFLHNISFFITPSFIAVIFACLSGYTKNFKIRQTAITLGFIALLFAIALFFIWFALGDYGRQQEYQIFVLTKASHLGVVSGIESLYLSISTFSVFLIISLLLCCISKSVGESSILKNIVIFAVLIYVLYICSDYFNSVKELLTNPLCLNILTFISAVIIPVIYLLVFGRKSYV